MIKRLVNICVACWLPAVATAVVADGLGGEELLRAVGAESRPAALHTVMLGDNGLWCVFARCDSAGLGYVIDRYSDLKAPLVNGGREGCADLITAPVVSPEWWLYDSHGYGDTLRYDLYNVLPCNPEVPVHKRDFPPGNVVIADYDNGYWSAGRGYLDGEEVNFYTPPRGYEGDFARIIFYMVAVYPCSRWAGLATNFYSGTGYPVFQPYAARQLMAWHYSDPVSDRERLRNDVIESVQGNRNPFVDLPELADYMWGSRAGDIYAGGGSGSGDDNPPAAERMPLRAVYSLSADTAVELVSPYVPADAEWYYAGSHIESDRLPLSRLGVGEHELYYTVRGRRGRVIIKVEP